MKAPIKDSTQRGDPRRCPTCAAAEKKCAASTWCEVWAAQIAAPKEQSSRSAPPCDVPLSRTHVRSAATASRHRCVDTLADSSAGQVIHGGKHVYDLGHSCLTRKMREILVSKERKKRAPVHAAQQNPTPTTFPSRWSPGPVAWPLPEHRLAP